MRVLITGAAGSGTSTLAQTLAEQNQAAFLEADHFFWLPTQPPFAQQRPPAERRAMLVDALDQHHACAVAGSVMGWGAEIEDAFDTIVFLYTPTEVRLARLVRRETERWGRAEPAFLAWASQYDAGPPEGRSLAKHNAWLAVRRCPVVRLDGRLPVADLQRQFATQAAGFRNV
nr:AAA family ATPase [Rhodoferax sp.]